MEMSCFRPRIAEQQVLASAGELGSRLGTILEPSPERCGDLGLGSCSGELLGNHPELKRLQKPVRQGFGPENKNCQQSVSTNKGGSARDGTLDGRSRKIEIGK